MTTWSSLFPVPSAVLPVPTPPDIGKALMVRAGPAWVISPIAAGDVGGLGALALLNTVSHAQIDDGSVWTGTLGDFAVTGPKIASGAVGASKLAASAVVDHLGYTPIPDALNDGKTYGRKNAAWAEIVAGGGGGGGIPEAPVDGKTYGRKDAAWAEFVSGGDPTRVLRAGDTMTGPLSVPILAVGTTPRMLFQEVTGAEPGPQLWLDGLRNTGFSVNTTSAALKAWVNNTVVLSFASTGVATFSGAVFLPGDPTDPLHAATKAYVDAAGGGGGGGTGDVVGPASSADNAIVRFDGTTGKLVQNSAVTISDTGGATFPVSATFTLGATFNGSPIINAGAGQERTVTYTTNSSTRWALSKSNETESGSNVGSNFWIKRYTDAGSLIGTALTITRSTGDATFSGSLAAGGNLTVNGLATISNNLTVGGPNVTLGTPISGVSLMLNGNAGTYRLMRFLTALSNRWIMGANNAPETGAAAGSNFFIRRVDDASGELDALTINRQSGLINVAASLAVGSQLSAATLALSGNLSMGPALYVNGPTPGPERGTFYQTSSVVNWFAGTSGAAADFQIARYNDVGSYLGPALHINRANGDASFSNRLIAGAGISVSGTGGNASLTINGDANSYVFFQTSAVESFRLVGNSAAFSVQPGGGAATYFAVHNNKTIQAIGVYDITTAAPANVNVAAEGWVTRSTSSLRYKTDIQDYAPGAGFDLLRPVTFRSTAELDTRAEGGDGGRRYAGLIAEEVHDAGLTEFVTYDAEGRPDGLAYGHMVAALISEVQAIKKHVGMTPPASARTVPKRTRGKAR